MQPLEVDQFDYKPKEMHPATDAVPLARRDAIAVTNLDSNDLVVNLPPNNPAMGD